LDLMIEDLWINPRLDASIKSTAGSNSELWDWLGIAKPADGRLQTQLDITGALQDFSIPADLPELLAWLEAGRWRGSFSVRAEDISYQ
ncbi:MAG: hypothetical protein GWN13_22035, partial [Phycisphaerae bacterium]|nr:hypothetical protein [Phycisphaerae bacterium]